MPAGHSRRSARRLSCGRQALRRQREFAADASHALRTPLTVIRSSVDYLARHRSESVGEVGDALDDITTEVSQMSMMVDDLLLLARSDSGAVELDRQSLDLGDIAAAATLSLGQPAADPNVRLVVDPGPASLVGDPVRLRQLVLILVDTAIRHTPNQRARCGCRLRADDRTATLTVADQGRGSARGPAARLRPVLARSRRAVGGHWPGPRDRPVDRGRHGGRIEVANVPGGGARFEAHLPRTPEPARRG